MKIGKTQAERLRRIAALKKTHDHKLAELEVEYKYQKDALRDGLRQEIALALETEGIPKRQVYLALGFQQQNQLTAFVEPLANRTGRTVENYLGMLRPEAEPDEVMDFRVVETGNGVWEYYFPNGKSYRITGTETGMGKFLEVEIHDEDWTPEAEAFLREWDGNREYTQIELAGYMLDNKEEN